MTARSKLATSSLTAAVALAGAFVRAADPAPVAWSQVREAIADAICVIEEPRMPSGYVHSYGQRARCGLKEASSPLDQAVQAAFDEVRPLMVTVPGVFTVAPPEIEKLYAVEDPVERQRSVAKAFLDHTPFLRTVLPRLEKAMAARGLACGDCPDLVPPEIRRKTWAEFSPYVSAFILPHSDAASFHVCSGVDAAKRVADPEPNLLRAGFLAAFQAESVRERTFRVLGEYKKDAAFLAIEDSTARIDVLHKAVAEKLRTDPDVRREACAALRPYVADLGVEVTDCARGETPEKTAN